MLIKSRKKSDCHESEVTEQSLFLNRRQFIQFSAASLVASQLTQIREAQAQQLAFARNNKFIARDKLSSQQDATHYNNFYEFSTDKEMPARLAKNFKTRPWTIQCEGELKKPRVLDMDDLLKRFKLEERIYRFRCVEAWSMVVPWVGFPLADLINYLQPTSKAKYIEFTTLYDPKQMPGQRRAVLEWPYVEGLRMDEAMHPLTLMVVGMYGEVLPNQNGAPLRLMAPWKYGFKNIKSIVKIRFTEHQPTSSWMLAGPSEYGFYANVNPQVDHPRWTQKRERRLGEFLKRPTEKFNGYEEEVAGLYQGMDLRKFF